LLVLIYINTNLQIATSKCAADDLKEKYDFMIRRNATLEKEIELLKRKIQDYEQQVL
jgi:cell division protein FtsB